MLLSLTLPWSIHSSRVAFKMFNGQNSQIVACRKITIVGKTLPHLDFVTRVRFRPRDDRFFSYNSHDLITFLTVSNDGKLTIVVATQGFHSKRQEDMKPLVTRSLRAKGSRCIEFVDDETRVSGKQTNYRHFQ